MKHLERHLPLALLFFLVSLTTSASAQEQAEQAKADSLEISLITCGPGHELYSLFGHTAIRINDKLAGQDLAVNYGLFSFNQPLFAVRFVFGRTDYEVGACLFSDFLAEYRAEGRWVYEQTLNLSAEEKVKLFRAIAVNCLPENRTYRYNIFRNNCTTKARDIIISCLNENVQFAGNDREYTYRELVHGYTLGHPWNEFGIDLLLGLQADRKLSPEEQQFLPENLMEDFRKARLTSDTLSAPLVSTAHFILPPTSTLNLQPSPLNPPTSTLLLLSLFICLLTLWERRKKRVYWAADLAILSVTGLAGLCLFVMIFSQHPTVSFNLQILLLNPCSIMLLYPVVKQLHRGRSHRWLPIYCGCLLLFLAGAIWQHYASGTHILALALLFRYTSLTMRLKQPR